MNQLARLWSGHPASPGFLIHDSTIFDGVDERQRAEAIELTPDAHDNGYGTP